MPCRHFRCGYWFLSVFSGFWVKIKLNRLQQRFFSLVRECWFTKACVWSLSVWSSYHSQIFALILYGEVKKFFHCCAGILLAFHSGTVVKHTRVRMGKLVQSWDHWSLWGGFPVAQSSVTALVNSVTKSHPNKCNTEANRLRSISLIALQI